MRKRVFRLSKHIKALAIALAACAHLASAISAAQADIVLHASLDRGAVGIDIPLEPAEHYNRAADFEARQDYRRALAEINKAVSRKPSFLADAFRLRGLIKIRLGQYEAAVADLTASIKDTPTPAAFYYRAAVRAQNKQYEMAIDDLTEALRLDPAASAVYSGRAKVHKDMGEHAKAIADLTRVIELAPDDCCAFYLRGMLYEREDRYEAAAGDYTSAIRRNPREGHTLRGMLYYRNGSYEEAFLDFSKLSEIVPDLEYAYVWMYLSLRKGLSQRLEDFEASYRERTLKKATDAWMRAVSSYYLGLGGLTEEDVLAQAGKGKDGQDSRGRLCEAYYYLAEGRLLRGDRSGAVSYFQKSVETGMSDYVEYQSSRAYLRTMDRR